MVLAVILVIIALGMLFGFLRGFKKSIVRLASVLLATVLAFVLALVISNVLITSGIVGDLLESLIEDFDEIEKLGSSTLNGLIQSVPVALITPIIFLILYFLLKAILWIPCKILYKVFKFDKKKKKKKSADNAPLYEATVTIADENNASETNEDATAETADGTPVLKVEVKDKVVSESTRRLQNKLLGIPLGAVQALVSVLVILFVVGGYLFAADKVVDGLMDIDDEVAEDLEDVEDVMDDITSEPTLSLFCSGDTNNFVFEGLTKVDVGGEKCSLTEEMVTIIEATTQFSSLMNDDDFDDEKLDDLDNLVSKLGDSTVLKTIAAEIVSNCGSKWADGEEFMDVSFADVNKNMQPIVNELLNIMATEKPKTIEKDMKVIVEVLSILDKHNLLEVSKYDDTTFLNTLNSGFASEIIDVLSTNKRFNAIIPEVENLSINILASALKKPDISDAEYDMIASEIADAMNYVRDNNNPEEVKQWVKDEIYNAVNTYGFEIGEDVADIAADSINSVFEDHQGEFTKETIKEYFDKYSLE